jgi:hypothetical protein
MLDPRTRSWFRAVMLCTALALPGIHVLAQAGTSTSATPAPAQRILGSVTAVNGDSVTVHQGGPGGTDVTISITPQTRMVRTVPGATSLKDATPLALSDLAVGDRVLIRPTPQGDAAHPSAAVLIAMKQGDLAQVHEQQSADWQRNGVAGIVQSMDAASGTITLRPEGAAAGGPGVHPLTIQTSASTDIRRYAADSTAFADTHKASFADIHTGDQIRARGAKDADGHSIEASEVVAGSFQNIAGTVVSSNASTGTLVLTDLATRKPVTLHLGAAAQLRKLPPEVAERMAHRQDAAAGEGAESHSAGGAPGGAGVPAGEQGAPRRNHAGDMASMLQRAPVITLADLKKGDAVMVVASDPSAPQRVALTVIAGVEPLLQASPEASAGLFSASWNLGGGGAADAGGDAAPQR